MGWMFSEGSGWLRMKVTVLVTPAAVVLLLELIKHPQVEAPTTIPYCYISLQAQTGNSLQILEKVSILGML